MISKKYKQTVKPVERLHQAGFTLAKGIDERASILSNDTVLHTVNLDLDIDGGAVLRRPLKIKRTFNNASPTGGSGSVKNIPTHIIPVPEQCCLLIYCDGFNTALHILDSENNVRSCKFEYLDLTDNTLKSLESDGNTFSYLNGVDFTNITFANLNTATLIYGVKFTTEFDIISPKSFVDMFDTNLIDSDSLDVLYRAIQVYYNTNDETFYIRIVSPDQTYLSNSEGEIPLDVNLAADNPYALRDSYDQTVPSVKGLIMYAPTVLTDGKVNVQYPERDTSVSRIVKSNIGTLKIPSKTNLTASDIFSFANHMKDPDIMLQDKFPLSVQHSSICDQFNFKLCLDKESSSDKLINEAILYGYFSLRVKQRIDWLKDGANSRNLFYITTTGSEDNATFEVWGNTGTALYPNPEASILACLTNGSVPYTPLCTIDTFAQLNLDTKGSINNSLKVRPYITDIEADSVLNIRYNDTFGYDFFNTDTDFKVYTESGTVSFKAPPAIGTFVDLDYAIDGTDVSVRNLIPIVLSSALNIPLHIHNTEAGGGASDRHILKICNRYLKYKTEDQESYKRLYFQGCVNDSTNMYYYFVNGVYDYREGTTKVRNSIVLRLTASDVPFDFTQRIKLQGANLFKSITRLLECVNS